MPELEDNKVDDGGEDKANSVLSRKLKKVLDSKLENDKDSMDALKELSGFFKDNNLKTRRNLRGEIERRNLQINQDFLSAFKTVKESLDDLHANVNGMSESCKSMQAKLTASKTKTHQLMSETTSLQSSSKTLAMQEAVATKFREKFILTNEEVYILQQRPDQQHKINQQFFDVLDKVQTIHRDCKVLLAAGHQTTALGVMEVMSGYQEAALQRLYRWTQSAVRNIEAPEHGSLVSRAMHYLQDRDVLFKYVIEEYTSSRRAILVKQFIDALTIGGPGGTPRPIEMHAHDPTRYVGDMLAWLHQAAPGEAENITQLLKLCDKTDIGQVSGTVLAGATEGVCRPLKTRVEQILVSEPGAVTLYRLTNLIRFYEGTVSNVVKQDCGLTQTLTDLHRLSYSQFMSILQSSVSSQLGRVEMVGDLAPAPATTSLLGLLRDILAGHSVVDSSQEDLPQILAAIADPLTAALQEMSSKLPNQDAAVFLINNLHQLKSTLSLYQATEGRLAELASRVDTCLKDLCKEQTVYVLASLELAQMITILNESPKDGGPLSSIPGTDRDSLSGFSSRLDSLLSAPDILLLPSTRLLLSSAHRKSIAAAAFKEVVSSYRQLYQAVNDPNHKYDNPASILTKTPDQVALLLQL